MDDNQEPRGDRKERGNKRGMDPKSRKDNLRNLINDDEFEPRQNRDSYRGDGRGQQRGRGGGNRGRGDGRRGGRGGPPMQDDGGRPGTRDNRGGNFHDRRDGGYNKGPMDNNYGPPYRMR